MTDLKQQEFEIIDAYGARWRYKRAEGYSWSFGVMPGTVDRDDRDVVLVWQSQDPDEEADCVATFPRVAMVGDVTENTCMNFNMREHCPPHPLLLKAVEHYEQALKWIFPNGATGHVFERLKAARACVEEAKRG